MVTVRMEEDDLLDLLEERCKFWQQGRDNLDLYQQMYENSVYGGVFDSMPFNVKEIVDNDIINNTVIVTEDDDEFEAIKECYENGDYDISCDTCYSYLEAVSEDKERFLVRC